VDMPNDAESVFNWQEIRENAFKRRAEIRRQRWRLKRRELELLASKNLLLPRVDLLGTYRIKGFGNDLFGHGNELQTDGDFSTQIDSSATGTFFNGDLQEWEIGVDASIPIGFRHQHAAVRHAELNLAREKRVLVEQQRQIVYGLSNAVGELRRAAKVRSVNQKRLEAANEQYAAIQNIYQEQDTTIDLVLEAQRRVIESKLQYFQSQVEYMLAVKAIHFEQGTLFQYHNIQFGEADAAFAEFDSILAADLVSAEPVYQQQPEYNQNVQHVPDQSNSSGGQPVLAPPKNVDSKTDSRNWKPELKAPKPDGPIGKAIKALTPRTKREVDSERPLRPNMFDDE